MDWWQVLGLLIGAPAAWEYLKWVTGFGRKKEYLEASNDAHVEDLEQLTERNAKLWVEIDTGFEERKQIIKDNQLKDNAILRLRLELEECCKTVARLQKELDKYDRNKSA